MLIHFYLQLIYKSVYVCVCVCVRERVVCVCVCVCVVISVADHFKSVGDISINWALGFRVPWS